MSWVAVVEFNSEADGSPVPEDAEKYPVCLFGPFEDQEAAVSWMENDYPDDDTDVHDIWADEAAAVAARLELDPATMYLNPPSTVTAR